MAGEERAPQVAEVADRLQRGVELVVGQLGPLEGLDRQDLGRRALVGAEDLEKVTVALLTAVAAAEGGRETLVFVSKEGVRLATAGVSVGTACEGCPPIATLMERYAAAGGRLLVCPLCFHAKELDETALVSNAQLGGTVQLWEWIGDGATTFSF